MPVALAVLGFLACGRVTNQPDQNGAGGSIGTTSAGGSDMTTVDAGRLDDSCSPSASLAPARIVLLTNAQYTNAVRDVFGVEFYGDVSPVLDTTHSYYVYNEATSVSLGAAMAYHQAALQIADKVKPCGDSTPDAACVEKFLRSTVPLAWRRPVDDDELASIMSLFNAGLQISAGRAVEVAMGAVLESGSFLYRTEIGTDAATTTGKSIELTAYELASALSFAFLDSVPDAALRAKADDGSILDPSVLSAEADRLLAVQGVRDNLRKKVSYFLSLERIPPANHDPFANKDPTTFPEYTTSLRDDLYRGSQLFLDDILWRGHFPDLFSSHRVYANASTGAVYGIPGAASAPLVAIDVDGDTRGAGILTQPAFLIATNLTSVDDDPIHRGLAIYDDFACGATIGAPPANEPDVFNSLMGTAREKWLQVDLLPTCGACHAAFTPLGLASHAYDAIGRYRSTDPDNHQPIDASGVLAKIGPDIDGPVTNINDVAKKLASGTRASDCVAYHMTNMTVEHPLGSADNCRLKPMKDALSKQTFAAFFKAVVTSAAFLTRDMQP